MAQRGIGYITHALESQVRVLLIGIEQGDRKIGTCCVSAIGYELATELGMNLLP